MHGKLFGIFGKSMIIIILIQSIGAFNSRKKKFERFPIIEVVKQLNKLKSISNKTKLFLSVVL